MSGIPRVSAIVPACDASGVLERTVARLADTLAVRREDRGAPAAHARGEGGEILIVENASSDDTWAVAQRLVDTDAAVPIRALRSAPGLGCAYREGLRAAVNPVALLTADDLPFGTTDLEAWRDAGRPAGVVVGSKAHPGSYVPRPWVRRTLSAVFRQARRGLLDLPVGDTQGTLLVPTAWAREVLPALVEKGYLFPTELIYVAAAHGLPVTEIPVLLDEDHAQSPTRVRGRDVVQMAAGLVAMRRRPAPRRADGNAPVGQRRSNQEPSSAGSSSGGS